MSSQREVADHIERARRFYDDPNTIHVMRSDEMFSVDHWHTEFYIEPPDVGRIDENAYMALRLGTSSRSHILDFSCGVGGFSRRMVETYACTMSGLNLSAEQVAWARRENSLNGQIEFKSYDGQTFPFAAAQFDGVSSQETLCHVPNRDEIFRELFRVLKPSGKICIQDWFMAEGLERERLVESVQPVDEAFATKVSTMSEYESLLRAAGFVDVETCRASDLPGFALRDNGRGVTDPGMLERCHAVGRAFQNGTMLVGFVSASKPVGR